MGTGASENGCAPLNLKRRSPPTDADGMFVRSRHAPAPGGQDLRSLRLSLNSPVVARDDFPVGPAAAALLAFGSSEAPRHLLVLRAMRGGHLTCFELADPAGVERPEALLAAAEGMGLLFDDELLAEAGEPGRARAAWTEFAGELALPAPEAQAARSPGLSKFRFRGGRAAPERRREAAWVRLLARY